MSKQQKAALLLEKGGQIQVQEIAVPKITKDNEILIQVHSAGLNPVDWKLQAYGFYIKAYPVILGFDAAGVVEEVGKSVTEFKKGDRVATNPPNLFSTEAGETKSGGFQQYLISPQSNVFKIPDSLSFDQGASIPLGIATAIDSLFGFFQFDHPGTHDNAEQKQQNQTVLVWGGASSVGAYAVQLLRNAGYTVISTASSKNHELVKSFGAQHVFDYTQSDVVAQIQKANVGKITQIFDAVSTVESITASLELLKAAEGGRLAMTTSSADGLTIPSNVQTYRGFAPNIFNKDQGKIGSEFFGQYIPKALEQGKLVPNKVRVLPGGLNAVQELLDAGKKGVSGEKLVIHPQK